MLSIWHPILATQPQVKYVIINDEDVKGYATLEDAQLARDLGFNPGSICKVEKPNKMAAMGRVVIKKKN